MTARDQYWLPAISPLFSSLSVLVGLAGLWLGLRERLWQPETALLGDRCWPPASWLGVLQWLVQLPPQMRLGIRWGRWRWRWRHPGVQAVLKVLLPATFASGMLHINVYVDLQFASYIPAAAAAWAMPICWCRRPWGFSPI